MSAKKPTPLRAVPTEGESAYYRYENPAPCRGCCRHEGHPFAALVLVVRNGRDGSVVKTMDAAPGGYEYRR